MDDEQVTALAVAARAGDPSAVDAFIRATQQDVWRFVAHLTDAQSADDLAQETYLRALCSLSRFAGRSSARTWLLSIARRVVVDRYRAASARPRKADLADWEETAERCQPRGLPGFEEGVALGDLLAGVPDERRDAFVLTQVLGLPYAEAAQVAGCPVGTVRSRVARARGQLITMLRAAEEDAERTRGTTGEGSRELKGSGVRQPSLTGAHASGLRHAATVGRRA
ncbi:sigma-70 family RNA polymerase sigma factor [Streptomyces sp. NPDC048506]|uniref:sigma-70 family RNA polymerase sigma factor n=1 Tax=Streptomyces sp. NPDC048506 TaxID=3155028 RepID=UPI0034276694